MYYVSQGGRGARAERNRDVRGGMNEGRREGRKEGRRRRGGRAGGGGKDLV